MFPYQNSIDILYLLLSSDSWQPPQHEELNSDKLPVKVIKSVIKWHSKAPSYITCIWTSNTQAYTSTHEDYISKKVTETETSPCHMPRHHKIRDGEYDSLSFLSWTPGKCEVSPSNYDQFHLGKRSLVTRQITFRRDTTLIQLQTSCGNGCVVWMVINVEWA